MDCWNTSFLLGPAYFQVRTVSFREGKYQQWKFPSRIPSYIMIYLPMISFGLQQGANHFQVALPYVQHATRRTRPLVLVRFFRRFAWWETNVR